MLILLAAALPALLGSGQPTPAGCLEVPAPRVDLRPNVARATSSPWVYSNAARYVRDPNAKFCIDAPGKQGPLAAAEAFAWGVAAYIRAAAPIEEMLHFLAGLPPADFPPRVNIGIVDDGKPATLELMNLLARRNLLLQVVPKPDPRLDINRTGVANAGPNGDVAAIRQELGDDKRLLRIYGTEVVIGRLTGDARRARLHLVNYAPRSVNGMRVRVLGNYSKAAIHVYGMPDAHVADFVSESGAAEFTVTAMNEYAVIDLQ